MSTHIHSKVDELQDDIGDGLFAALSEESRDFILKTEGMVDFGFVLTKESAAEIDRFLSQDYLDK